ncbi:MAG: hypothetical protein ACYC0X_24510 [Pirellulaceae bacterium]
MFLSYYHCGPCGTSQKPWDEVLRLSDKSLTPAAAQVTAHAGVLASFAEASERTLRTMCGLRISESTVERTTEEAGMRVAQQLAQGATAGPTCSWKWQHDAQGRTCAYVGVDHTGVRQQGPKGSRAEGKMVALGIVYNPRSDHDEQHPKEHLVELAQVLYGADEENRTKWSDERCHRLKHTGGQAILAELRAMDLSGHSEQVRECHRKQVTYFRNHAHRMDYPTYVSKGWQIGSGPVESACKTVVGNRLKGGGMRWGEAGTNAVAHLRAVYLSEPACWNQLWAVGQAP